MSKSTVVIADRLLCDDRDIGDYVKLTLPELKWKTDTMTGAGIGGDIDVPTLEGTMPYNIPAGTQEGTSFRIRGQGIQQLRSTGKGDLYFTVHVEVPKHLGEKQKDLLRQFEDSLSGREYERRKSFGDQMKSYIRENAERFKEKFDKK